MSQGVGETVGDVADEAATAVRGFSDEVLDVLLPEELEWERMVDTYPIPSLAVALTAGFFIGSRHGQKVVGALSGFLSGRVDRAIDSLLSD